MGGEADERHEDGPLHTTQVEQPRATINRLYIVSHFAATLAVLYYRACTLLSPQPLQPRLLAALLFASDLLLALLWTLAQSFRWRPISRTPFPDRLPDEARLPALDVFVLTADPEKEPTLEVMNTLVSTMCLDYPTDKLRLYLSDDGGSALTLFAARRAYAFARSWIPFCRTHRIESRCPEAYFSGLEIRAGNHAFQEDHQRIKFMYEAFKESVKEKAKTIEISENLLNKDKHRTACIEVVQDDPKTDARFGEQQDMPLLVYVSREKKKNYHHHFKAGALNVLLRVSGTISNSPYILVLDCDMYSNNPASAREAMCFHLDQHLSPSLAFVQFPQTFHNVSKNDIYCAELRSIFKDQWKGCDGLKGPILSGTCFYMKRDALYRVEPGHTSKEDYSSVDIMELKRRFGFSYEFISSLRTRNSNIKMITPMLLSEIILLASCTYEVDTQWGYQIGFLYESVVEDYFTGFHLHCRGWNSAYYLPSRPAFLGSVPISFNDTLIQNKRWGSGLLQVGFSRYCPLTFGISSKTSVLQCMCYAWLAFKPLISFPVLCYATISSLGLLKGITLFPPVLSPWFMVFAMVYVSSSGQHLYEIFLSKGSFSMWLREQRFWMMISVTADLFACLNIVMKLIGVREVNFDLTNKAVGEEQIRRYEDGIFDFEGTSLVLLPLTTLTILNVATLIGGGLRLFIHGDLDKVFGQIFLSGFIFVMSYPAFEGMIIRRDKGRVPTFITLLSVLLAGILLLLFHLSF